MAHGFPAGALVWRARFMDGREVSANDGLLASKLNPKALREFGLYPTRRVQPPLLHVDAPTPIPMGALATHENGSVRLIQPDLVDSFRVIRRREVDAASGSKVFEVWFVGLAIREKPTTWLHVRPGLVEVTTRGPDARTR